MLRAVTALPEIESAGIRTLASMRRLVAMMREDDDEPAVSARDSATLRELVDGFSGMLGIAPDALLLSVEKAKAAAGK